MTRELQGYTPGYPEPNPYPYPSGPLPLYPGVWVFPTGLRVQTLGGFTQGYGLIFYSQKHNMSPIPEQI